MLGLAGLAGGMVLAGGPVAWPFDVVLNLGGVEDHANLHAPADGGRHVVVLVHGVFRTAASLGRLERTLARHGYEVWNVGYASTADTLDAHATTLHEAIERRRPGAPIADVAFVGHSMGGLVIQEYLRRPGALVPRACVYLGTPHRGAVLADLRRHWFLFRWAMGSKAAQQLSPGDAFHGRPLPCAAVSGVLVGDLGEGHAAIPGPDDGTVGVAEATMPGAKAVRRVPFGHTSLSMAPEVLRQVLHFLAKGAFADGPGGQ
ncbi:MAG: alpha/beta fold hydrolase [Planctomycetes bacterium]|nr:alpha/beta fold hydrolase [Planctomycetota bacterium]